MWWLIPVILALERPMKEDYEKFKARLASRVGLCLKHQKQQTFPRETKRMAEQG